MNKQQVEYIKKNSKVLSFFFSIIDFLNQETKNKSL